MNKYGKSLYLIVNIIENQAWKLKISLSPLIFLKNQ